MQLRRAMALFREASVPAQRHGFHSKKNWRLMSNTAKAINVTLHSDLTP